MELPTLDIAIVTHGGGAMEKIEKVLLEPIEGINYVISWQNHHNQPISNVIRSRKDVKVCRLDSPGISNNRNNSIMNCNADLILLGDDDLKYNPEGLQKLREKFRENQSVDVGLFQVDFLNKKNYPTEECNVSVPLPKGYFVTSMEIAFRRKKTGDLAFYPELGLGSREMACGEEELFLLSSIKRGLNCRFFPIVICQHPGPTTGNKATPPVLKGMGFIIAIYYPQSWPFRLILKAYRIAKKERKNFIRIIYNLFSGSIKKITTFSSIEKKYRW